MNTKNQLLCTWSAPVFLTLFAIGWWFIAWFVPPPSPAAGAEEIAQIYRDNAVSIKMGMVIAMFSSGLVAPFLAVISTQMMRMEGRFSVLSFTQMLCGAMGVVTFLIAVMIWLTLAFRPERDPQLTQLLNDLAWLLLTVTIGPAFIQNIAIAIAVFTDRNTKPVFPRWVGYFNIWVPAAFIPAMLVPFFRTGPFAWDGIIGFWVPLVDFGIWTWVMFFLLRKAIREQALERPGTP